jgi:hypothetical protein
MSEDRARKALGRPAALAAACLALASTGCALFRPLFPPAPPPPPLSQQEVVEALESRAGLIRTVGDGSISLSLTLPADGKPKR